MDGIWNRYIPVATDHDGKGGGYFIIFALVIIFFVLIGLRWNDGHREHHEHHEKNGWDSIAPFMAASMFNGNQSRNDANLGSCCRGPSLCEVEAQEMRDAKELMHDQDKNFAGLQHSMDLQGCETQKQVGLVIENQNRIALDAERQAHARDISEKNEKLAEYRAALTDEKAKNLHQETINALGHTNGRIDNVACELRNEFAQMSARMPERMPYYAAGGTPLVNACVPGDCRRS
jgi:hypothetical protein